MKFTLVIGAQKAGTTWLYDNLKRCCRHTHALAHIKEINFFPEFYRLGDWYHRHRTAQIENVTHHLRERREAPQRVQKLYDLYSRSEVDLAWYLQVFSELGFGHAIDVSPEYAHMPKERVADVAARINVHSVILIVRHPVDRAVSHITMDVTRGTGATVDVLVRSNAVRARSDYRQILDTWSACFPGQVHVLRFDEITTAPKRFLDRVLEIVDFRGQPDYSLCDRMIHKGADAGVVNEAQILNLREGYAPLTEYYEQLIAGIPAEPSTDRSEAV